ncbi:MAG TPA: hypothetical protein VMW32_00730 [Bacteroidales bacterium]|nr:hypothetical protein [Bacteroidales bacterium]
MEAVIYLTKEQADKVRGRHGKYSALDPIEAEDGNFILPKDVLSDPEHKEVLGELLKCKEAEIEVETIKDEKLSDDDPIAEKQVIKIKKIKELTAVAPNVELTNK